MNRENDFGGYLLLLFSVKDYMDDVHGKEISLQYVTVKVPGQKPRGSRSIITVAGANGSNSISEGLGGLSLNGKGFLPYTYNIFR